MDFLNWELQRVFYLKVRGGFRKGHKYFKSESLNQKSENFNH
jgi:hypothetical protein